MSTPDIVKENFDELVASLKPIEEELSKRGTKYFGGKFIKMYY